MTPTERLKSTGTVVIDWPTKEVPDTLARAGLRVVVRGGPGPEDYSLYELRDGAVRTSRLGRAPETADLIYAYRPIAELSSIIETAKRLNAKENLDTVGYVRGRRARSQRLLGFGTRGTVRSKLGAVRRSKLPSATLHRRSSCES